jgi:hypothetical protein
MAATFATLFFAIFAQPRAVARDLHDLGAGKMVRANGRGEHFAKIDELGFETLDFQPNGAAAGKCQRHRSGWSVMLGKFDGEKIEHAVLVALIETAASTGDDAFEAKRCATAAIFRSFVLERVRIDSVHIDNVHPVEALDRHDEAVLARTPQDVADLDQGVLQMSGHHLDIVFLQGDELKFLMTAFR